MLEKEGCSEEVFETDFWTDGSTWQEMGGEDLQVWQLD